MSEKINLVANNVIDLYQGNKKVRKLVDRICLITFTVLFIICAKMGIFMY